MTRGFLSAISIRTCCAVMRMHRDWLRGDSLPIRMNTGDMTRLCQMRSALKQPGRSRNMRTRFSPSRYRFWRPFTNILPCITSGMIRCNTNTKCSSTSRGCQLIFPYSVPGNLKKTGLPDQIKKTIVWGRIKKNQQPAGFFLPNQRELQTRSYPSTH